MSEKKCSCENCCFANNKREYQIPVEGKESTLADLPVGTKATIVKIMPKARGSKKLADVGIVPGSELLIEAHAPFGGLIRVKVMETSMALHKDEAANIVMMPECE
ncbi:MAG: ferrous iron transport protein A [Lentisphaeria bacterium]|nr:ferrous iron transport protein A [Lentisphaeria bacterium]